MASFRITFTFNPTTNSYDYEVIDAAFSIIGTVPLPTGASTAAKQLSDNHNVTVSNQLTGFATAVKQLADNHNVTVSNQITGFALAANQLADDHNVTVSNMITGFALAANQLADNHNVTVSNPTADPETGLATSAKQLANSHDVQIKSYTGASQQYPRLDPSTFNIQTITESHGHVHESRSFHVYVNVSGGSGTKATISFTTPDTTSWAHLAIHARGNVESHLTFGETATITADSGSDFAPLNRNRNSAVESTLISAGSSGGAGNVTTGGTVTDFGTILHLEHLGNNKIGEENRGEIEFVLKQNTTYAIELETESASSEAFIELEYYEHTDLE